MHDGLLVPDLGCGREKLVSTGKERLEEIRAVGMDKLRSIIGTTRIDNLNNKDVRRIIGVQKFRDTWIILLRWLCHPGRVKDGQGDT